MELQNNRKKRFCREERASPGRDLRTGLTGDKGRRRRRGLAQPPCRQGRDAAVPEKRRAVLVLERVVRKREETINFESGVAQPRLQRRNTMAFETPKVKYSGKIREITLGTGPKAVTVGGATSYPFHLFEGEMPRRPASPWRSRTRSRKTGRRRPSSPSLTCWTTPRHGRRRTWPSTART